MATESFAFVEDRSFDNFKIDAARELERLHETWVTTSLTSNHEKDLKFTASAIEVEKDKDLIKFTALRLNKRPIKPAYFECSDSTTNWLGFEKCIAYQEVANARHLCEQLGYGQTIQTNVIEVNNNSYISVWSLYQLTGTQWHSIRSASMLGGSYKLGIIQDFSCRLN